MNNLQSHWHILYTCNTTKITIYKRWLSKENVFQKKKNKPNVSLNPRIKTWYPTECSSFY